MEDVWGRKGVGGGGKKGRGWESQIAVGAPYISTRGAEPDGSLFGVTHIPISVHAIVHFWYMTINSSLGTTEAELAIN